MDILEVLTNLNPWWKEKRVETEKYHRSLFQEIYNDVKARNGVTAIVGPRQVGKTVLIYQVIEQLLEDGINPLNILYLNFDSRVLRVEAKGNLDYILDYYSKNILKKELDGSERIFVFIDEVQKLDDWGNQVKYWHDLSKNVKIIVSGSSALKILKGSGESLIGRIRVFILLTFSFREFIEYKGIKVEKINGISEVVSPPRSLLLQKGKLELLLLEYLRRGGYPRLIKLKRTKEAYRELLDIKSLSLKRDILDIEEVRDASILEDLLVLLADSSCNKINYEKLAETLGINRLSVQKYISLFEDIYFVKRTYIYSESEYVSTRKERKIHFIDNGMINALLYKFDFPESYMGKLAENAVFSFLFAIKLKDEIEPKIFYWDKGEVDLIIRLKNKIFGIEVKYRDKLSEADLRNIKSFMEKRKGSYGIVVTKNESKVIGYKRRKIYLIPLWLFLLISM